MSMILKNNKNQLYLEKMPNQIISMILILKVRQSKEIIIISKKKEVCFKQTILA
jgi:hypothetical protein